MSITNISCDSVSFTDLNSLQSNGTAVFEKGPVCISEGEIIPITKVNERKSNVSVNQLVTDSLLNGPTIGPSGSIPIESPPEFSDISPCPKLNKSSRRRLKGADPKSWLKNRRKELRMRGKRFDDSNKENVVTVRTFGPRPVCKTHGNVFKCSQVTEELRERLFRSFWDDLNWGQKKVYVRSLCEKISAARTKLESPRRITSVRYNLFLDGNVRVRVCKDLFLSTFGIGKTMVSNWCKLNMTAATADSDRNLAIISKPAVKFATTFLEDLPKQESHYCRKTSSKLYLEPLFTTFAQLYSVYKENCSEGSHQAVSKTWFKEIFDKLNLSLFAPKKDLCNTCELFKVNEITQEEHAKHQLKKSQARREKDSDKQECILERCHVITVDLQGVKQAPVFNANCVYFKSKLNVYNYTVYDLGTRNARCYYWNETQGGLSASVFASLLIDYIQSYSDKKPVIIYSDGCGYQNRNVVLSNALLNYSMKSGVTIIQKYLEKGHTQMECDSVHSLLERKSKNVKIRIPSDYLSICLQARKNPFEAKEISHDFFNDFSCKSYQRYNSIRPGSNKGGPEVKDIRALKYDPSGIIFYKIDFCDDWELLPQKIRKISICDSFIKLYESPLKLKQRKWEDLQYLKQYLPRDSRAFYDNLPH